MRELVIAVVASTTLLFACAQTESALPDAEDVAADADLPRPSDDATWRAPTPDVPPPPPDTGPVTCPQGSGCFGDPCDDADDCWSGYCADHLGDGTCTKTCEDTCPDGWSCEQVAIGGDPVFLCVSQTASLCRPCTTASDCALGGGEDACVNHGDGGFFCGATCHDDLPCPDGFTCALTETTGGGSSLQCVPTNGECACSETARELGLSTTCSITNTHGTCDGTRVCTSDGLTSCDALIPATDGCDHIDNDCDGETDEACSYRISGYLLGDGAGTGASEGATVRGAVGTPRVIGTSTHALWTVRSGLVWTGGE